MILRMIAILLLLLSLGLNPAGGGGRLALLIRQMMGAGTSVSPEDEFSADYYEDEDGNLVIELPEGMDEGGI